MTTPRAEALQIFVNATIGGEPLGTTATSDLMLRTATKALGAAGTLIDSPAIGVPAARPLTRTIRGAGVVVYLLSDTLSGRGLKRGLGLLVLAVGATLVAVSLLGTAAPAWMATAGFGILLGGLAFAALSSGMITHALVLATPIVPLLVWSSMQTDESGDSAAGRIVQIGLIVLLIVTALLMGSVSTPAVGPEEWARAPERRWGSWLGRLLATLVVVAFVVTAGVLIPKVPLSSGWWIFGVCAVLGLAAVVLGSVAFPHARRLRDDSLGEDAVPEATRAATVAAWAWAYGAVYLVIAVLIDATLALVWAPGLQSGEMLVAMAVSFAVLSLICFAVSLRVRVRVRVLVPPSA